MDAIVFRPAEGLIVTGSEDRFMKVRLLRQDYQVSIFSKVWKIENWEEDVKNTEVRWFAQVERKQQMHTIHILTSTLLYLSLC